MQVKRFAENPIITPHMDARMGANINGPSLIRAPDWLPDPLGKYYLYFAHHQGQYIRLAYADSLAGPWQTYKPGVLTLEQSPFRHHVASPDVHIDRENRRIIMYCHGPAPTGGQRTSVATSTDGLNFSSSPEVFATSYLRAFKWEGITYAMSMPGIFCRSQDGLSGFEQGPTLFSKDMRHAALKLEGNILNVFYSNAHDCPEHILQSQIELTADWLDWHESEPESILLPETDYEGGNLELKASERGSIHEMVRQLRDPCIYEEDGRTYLLYSVAGEDGIAIAELIE